MKECRNAFMKLYQFTHQIGSVNHVRVPITCHPVRKNFGGF